MRNAWSKIVQSCEEEGKKKRGAGKFMEEMGHIQCMQTKAVERRKANVRVNRLENDVDLTKYRKIWEHCFTESEKGSRGISEPLKQGSISGI